MNTRTLALAGFIVLAALTRLLPHPDNFAPITAMAVFGAIRFGSRQAAVLAPLLALLLSDLVLEVLFQNGLSQRPGLYPGMEVIYGTTALIAILGRFAHGTRSPSVIAATTLGGSCVFFLVTNFAFWAEGSLYPRTAEGLAMCYAAAIPFFRFSLLGDVTYAALFFGAWALAEARFPVLKPDPTLATA